MIETHPAYRDTMVEVKRQGTNIYDYLNQYLQGVAERERAASISYLARHHFFHGDLGENRSPVADANMRGAMIGISSDVSVRGLALCYYSTMEFIALQTRHIVDTMNEAGHSIRSIFMSGSQCQNEVLIDLIATSCSVIVVIPHYVDAAVVHGAAMLGAKAASAGRDGKTEDLWSIMDRMSKPGRVVKPSIDTNEKRLLEYGVFLDQCRMQQEYRRRVDEAVSRWHRG